MQISENCDSGTVRTRANLVDLENHCKMNIYSQNRTRYSLEQALRNVFYDQGSRALSWDRFFTCLRTTQLVVQNTSVCGPRPRECFTPLLLPYPNSFRGNALQIAPQVASKIRLQIALQIAPQIASQIGLHIASQINIQIAFQNAPQIASKIEIQFAFRIAPQLASQVGLQIALHMG